MAQDIEKYTNVEYWLNLVDHRLHVENTLALRRCVVPLLMRNTSEQRKGLIESGICALELEEALQVEEDLDWEDYPIGWGIDLQLLTFAMSRLIDCGWPAIFMLIYDEAWILWHRSASYLKHFGLRPNYDFAAFYVDNDKAGWPPHRDRDDATHGNNSISQGFFADGIPKHCTLWIALSEATVQNSCLYCVPKQYDPGYFTKVKGGPLATVFFCPNSFQHILALPCNQGQAWLFSHRLLHWGSKRHFFFFIFPKRNKCTISLFLWFLSCAMA
mmetsp:Transcript_17052/g.20912  ORF Transcript_17052/g.20912 Transcript_17052/m.20912 type:complete len:272 (-) Transcript_17052:798-1613(-)